MRAERVERRVLRRREQVFRVSQREKQEKGSKRTDACAFSSSAESPENSAPLSKPSSFSTLATVGTTSSVSCKTASISIASVLAFLRAGSPFALSSPTSIVPSSAPSPPTNHFLRPLPSPRPLAQMHNEFEFCTPRIEYVCVAVTSTAESDGSPRISSGARRLSGEVEESCSRRAGGSARSWYEAVPVEAASADLSANSTSRSAMSSAKQRSVEGEEGGTRRRGDPTRAILAMKS